MKRTNLNEALVSMPELPHKDDAGKFDIQKSKAIDWMVANGVVRQYIWDLAVDRGCIVFDQEKGTWSGVGDGNLKGEKQQDGRKVKMESRAFEQYRVREVAKALGVTPRMIYKWEETATSWSINDGVVTYKKTENIIDL